MPLKLAYQERFAFEDIVGAVVYSAEAERWATMVAFRGVVEHHVQNDLDPRPVQCFDHVAKLVHCPQWILPRAVGLVRRKERNSVHSPNS